MTSFGFHYFPDESHHRVTDLHAWLPELRALGARWLTLIGSLSRAVPEAFIKELLNGGIQPIVHIPATPVRPIDLPALEPLLKTYARWGVQHVVVFSEPNTRAAWLPSEWGKTALVERFLDLLLPVLHAQASAGLQPTFPALKAGGEYWDTSFLEATLASLVRRGEEALVKQLTFALNLWTFNRPTPWGAGGLKAWPEAKPYLTPPGSQDQRGFHLFDWYDEIIRSRLGEPHPLLCLAGGPCLGDQTDANFPATDEARHTSCTQEIVQAAAEGGLPANLLNVNFWLLGAAEASPFAREAWYRGDGTTLTAVDLLKRHALKSQSSGARPAQSLAANKPLRHYLLLPTFEWGISEWHWQAALAYMKAFRPVCGFSVDEARHAERVTIAGNDQGVSYETEAMLRQAGCVVERIRLTSESEISVAAPDPSHISRHTRGDNHGQSPSDRDQSDGPGGWRVERRQPDDRTGSRRD
jgi:hypothetical protein